MNRIAVTLLSILCLAAAVTMFSAKRAGAAAPATLLTPVVVELFTSEGCSSCPPADALLRQFDAQPFPTAELIVLSEHVDYWNHIGWSDPYSSHAYSERQSAYGKHLHLDGVYTPQMIVDGTREFVGSNSRDADQAIAKASSVPKIAVRITDAKLEADTLHARIEASPLPAGIRSADVLLVAALNRAESQVSAGENSGRRLTHVAVVRALKKAGTLSPGQSFTQEVVIKLEKHVDPADLRAIALVQEPGPGKILGAAQQRLSK
jgi:hypothetical protein